MEEFSNQPASSEFEPDEATRVAWEVRGHLQHYHACEPQSIQAKAALADADSAFSRLFLLTNDQLRRSAMQRTGGDYYAASDILQETYLRAWENLPKLRGDSQITTWLHSIMYTRLSTWYKRQAKYVLGGDEDFNNQFTAIPSLDATNDDPETYFENKELQETLYSNIKDHLSPKERDTVIGRFILEIRHKVLAQRIGDKSVSATKVRLHRSLLKLRKVYQSHM